MGDFTVYILKSSLSIAVFFLFYKLLLSRETFHKFNRVLLIVILLLSFIIPFINISLKSEVSYAINTAYLEQLLNGEQGNVTTETVVPFWATAIVFLYLAGVLVALYVQIISFIRMIGIIRKSKLHSTDGGVKVYISKKKIAPFSWMNCFVINEDDFLSEGEIVATHEKAHIALRHSFDILMCQVALVFQWFNPAIYLLKQELQAIHEYEADEAVINKGIDAKKYQLLLIKKAVGHRLFTLANSFNHGKLKKRITMMVREKSKKWAAIKAIFILPAAAIALTAFASEKVSAKTDLISKAEIQLPATLETPVLKDTIKIKKELKVIKVIVTNKDGKSEKKLFINGKEVPQDSLKNYDIKIDSATGKKHFRVDVSNIDKKVDGRSYIVIRENGDSTVKINATENFIVVRGYKTKSDTLNVSNIVKSSSGTSWTTKEGKEVVVVKGENVKIMIKGVKDSTYVVKSAKTAKIPSNLLCILDGVEVTSIENIEPNSIESLSVLKNEKAIEKYGEKGKNGVIVIVTKKSK